MSEVLLVWNTQSGGNFQFKLDWCCNWTWNKSRQNSSVHLNWMDPSSFNQMKLESPSKSHLVLLILLIIIISVLSGCYGTLGLESGGVADTQLSASSVWEWKSEWAAAGARLKKAGFPWTPSQSDQKQWLTIDLRREKRITGNKNTQSLILL